MKESLDRRWCIVLDLQERLQKLQPGSEAANIMERAIFLAINSVSQEHNYKFFRYDIVRNARFSYLRTKARQRRLWKKAALLIDAWTEDSDWYAQLDLEAELRQVVAQSGDSLAKCFDGMVNGESIAVTALACGVSRRSVDRLRQKVRQIVQSYLDDQEAA